MKILNLYAGIGGNRKLWDNVRGGDFDITAVEYDEHIAKAYQDRFPSDRVIVADAKEYLLRNYKDFDFIWVSPPCQTHSCLVHSNKTKSTYIPQYPDMTLYQIIYFLQLHSKLFKYVVESVNPFYEPLIKPNVKIDWYLYWSNFYINKIEVDKMYIHEDVKISSLNDFDLGKYRDIKDKKQVIRNQVNYEIGKHILECALMRNDYVQGGLFENV